MRVCVCVCVCVVLPHVYVSCINSKKNIQTKTEIYPYKSLLEIMLLTNT